MQPQSVRARRFGPPTAVDCSDQHSVIAAINRTRRTSHHTTRSFQQANSEQPAHFHAFDEVSTWYDCLYHLVCTMLMLTLPRR